MKQFSRIQLLLIGTGVGIFSGVMGVGGGILMVPVLTAIGLAQHEAHATSLAVIVPIACASTLVYGLHGQLDWLIAGVLIIGSILGARIGALVMHKIPARHLKILFSCLLLVAGIEMVLS